MANTHDRRWWILAVLCLSVLVVSIDNTIVNVALPTISRELDATTSQLQWVVDAYTLVFAGLLLLGGHLGDRFGRRRMLQLGIAAFAVTSLIASFASSAGELIAGRAAMGASAALIYPATLALLSSTFTDRARARRRHRHLVRGDRPRVALGPGDRRPAAGALLVGRRVVGQRAGRRHRPARRPPRGAREPQRPPGPVRPDRRVRLDRRHRAAGLDDDRGAVQRLGLGADDRWIRSCRSGSGRLRRLGAAAAGPAARHAAVPQPALLGRERCDRVGLLRSVRLHLPDHAVLPGRPRLLDPAGRRRDAALRPGDRRRVPPGHRADAQGRHQGHRHRRPADHDHRLPGRLDDRSGLVVLGTDRRSRWC